MSAVVFVMRNQRTTSFFSYDGDDNCNSSSLQDHGIVGDQLPQPHALPKFSIRDYVFAARKEDVGKNWPFSKKSLKLCLKHGVKDLLPRFQQLDSLHRSSVGRSSVVDDDAVLPEVHKGTLDNDSSLPLNINQLASDSSVSDPVDQRKLAQRCPHLESRGEVKDLESNTIFPRQSVLESASTHKLPSSENSDEQEVSTAPAAERGSDVNLLPSSFKRNRSVVKAGTKTDHKVNKGTSMSDFAAPCELMASKVCPVCGTFSSSSNTTLNAHIDQCLFLNTSDRVENLKMTSKPRIKPRKIRLMADICATAPCCTLEDLDIRNDSNWVSHATELRSEDTDPVVGVKRRRVLSRQIHESVGDSAVYIDASGTKFRILSSLDDAPSPVKSTTDLEMKKPEKDDKPRKSLAPNKMECLPKNSKNHKQIVQRKELSRKSCSLKAVGDNLAGSAAEACQREGKHLAPVSKTSEINKLGDLGMLKKWVRSKRTGFSRRCINIRRCGHSVHVVEQMRELAADSDQSCLGESHMRSDLMKLSSVSENCNSSSKSSFKADEMSYEACDGDSWCSTKRNRLDSPLCRDPKHTSVDSTCGDAVENHVDVEDAARYFHLRGTVGSLRVFSSEGRESFSSRNDIYLSSASPDLAQQPMADKSNSSLMCRLKGVGDEMVQWPVEVQSDLVQDKNHNFPKTSAGSALGHCNQADERSNDFSDGVTDTSHDRHDWADALQTQKMNDGDSPSILGIEKTVERDADFHEFPAQFDTLTELCTEEYHEHSFAAEGSAPQFEPSPSGAGHDMTAINNTNSVLNVGLGSSFFGIDPIPIPGPPGSDLPSPRDMESEILKVNRSHPTSQVQCFYNQEDMTDRDSLGSPSPGSATTTISNFTETLSDWKISEPCMKYLPVDERGLQERDNSVSSIGCFRSVTLDVDSAQRGMMPYGDRPLISTVPNQPCCCSWKEVISWDADLRYEDHRNCPLCPVTVPALEKHMRINEKARTDRSTHDKNLVANAVAREVAACGTDLPTPIDCDSPSVSPSTLVFRLMGKNLTITNNDKNTQAWGPAYF